MRFNKGHLKSEETSFSQEVSSKVGRLENLGNFRDILHSHFPLLGKLQQERIWERARDNVFCIVYIIEVMNSFFDFLQIANCEILGSLFGNQIIMLEMRRRSEPLSLLQQ